MRDTLYLEIKQKYSVKDKVCYKGKPYKIIGRKFDPSFFILVGLDRQIEIVHKQYLTKIEL